jgi:hypothetical protein
MLGDREPYVEPAEVGGAQRADRVGVSELHGAPRRGENIRRRAGAGLLGPNEFANKKLVRRMS